MTNASPVQAKGVSKMASTIWVSGLTSRMQFLPTGTGAIGSESNSASRTGIVLRVGLLSLFLFVLVIAYLWLRGTRGLTPSNQMYAKLSRGASWGGIQPAPR